MTVSRNDRSTVVGLIPAAGSATRLGSPSRSKELLRVWRPPQAPPDAVPEPAIRCLLSALESAGAQRTVVVLREGKEDIPAELGPSTEGGMRLDYLRIRPTPAPPFTLATAVPRIAESTVILGFPDILFAPASAIVGLLECLDRTGGDIALGLFPHPVIRRADVVELATDAAVTRVDRSSEATSESRSWALAAWRPRFTRFLQDFVNRAAGGSAHKSDLGLADVINAAIADGLTVIAEPVSEEPFLDIGTPGALKEAYRRLEAP